MMLSKSAKRGVFESYGNRADGGHSSGSPLTITNRVRRSSSASIDGLVIWYGEAKN